MPKRKQISASQKAQIFLEMLCEEWLNNPFLL